MFMQLTLIPDEWGIMRMLGYLVIYLIASDYIQRKRGY